MKDFLVNIMTWSEGWGILIPLVIIIYNSKRGRENRYLVLYVWIATILNLATIIIAKFHDDIPALPQSNLVLYNINSIIRVILFSLYLNNLKGLWSQRLIKIILPLYLCFVAFDFISLESFLSFSGNIHAAESIVLLVLCITFFLSTIQDNSDIIWMQHPAFLICAGISLYEAINFFVFLFFNVFNVEEKQKHDFGEILLIVFSISYVILCVLLAIVFYNKNKKKELEAI